MEEVREYLNLKQCFIKFNVDYDLEMRCALMVPVSLTDALMPTCALNARLCFHGLMHY